MRTNANQLPTNVTSEAAGYAPAHGGYPGEVTVGQPQAPAEVATPAATSEYAQFKADWEANVAAADAEQARFGQPSVAELAATDQTTTPAERHLGRQMKSAMEEVRDIKAQIAAEDAQAAQSTPVNMVKNTPVTTTGGRRRAAQGAESASDLIATLRAEREAAAITAKERLSELKARVDAHDAQERRGHHADADLNAVNTEASVDTQSRHHAAQHSAEDTSTQAEGYRARHDGTNVDGILRDEQGVPLSGVKQEAVVLTDKFGNPLHGKKVENVVLTDKFGNPLHGKKVEKVVLKDKFGNPLSGEKQPVNYNNEINIVPAEKTAEQKKAEQIAKAIEDLAEAMGLDPARKATLTEGLRTLLDLKDAAPKGEKSPVVTGIEANMDKMRNPKGPNDATEALEAIANKGKGNKKGNGGITQEYWDGLNNEPNATDFIPKSTETSKVTPEQLALQKEFNDAQDKWAQIAAGMATTAWRKGKTAKKLGLDKNELTKDALAAAYEDMVGKHEKMTQSMSSMEQLEENYVSAHVSTIKLEKYKNQASEPGRFGKLWNKFGKSKFSRTLIRGGAIAGAGALVVAATEAIADRNDVNIISATGYGILAALKANGVRKSLMLQREPGNEQTVDYRFNADGTVVRDADGNIDESVRKPATVASSQRDTAGARIDEMFHNSGGAVLADGTVASYGNKSFREYTTGLNGDVLSSNIRNKWRPVKAGAAALVGAGIVAGALYAGNEGGGDAHSIPTAEAPTVETNPQPADGGWGERGRVLAEQNLVRTDEVTSATGDNGVINTLQDLAHANGVDMSIHEASQVYDDLRSQGLVNTGNLTLTGEFLPESKGTLGFVSPGTTTATSQLIFDTAASLAKIRGGGINN